MAYKSIIYAAGADDFAAVAKLLAEGADANLRG
jgi:hypothetical protein